MIVSKLQVVEEAAKEVLLRIVPELAQFLHTLDTALHHGNELVGYRLRVCVCEYMLCVCVHACVNGNLSSWSPNL